MDSLVIEDLRKNKLFQNVDFDSLLFDIIDGNIWTLSQGELLYREGEKSNSIFLIIRGEINSIPSQFNSINSSIIYAENDFFGVNELISGMPRSKSAIAIKDTSLVEFSKIAVNNLIKQNKEIRATIYSSSEQTKVKFKDIINKSSQPKDEVEITETSDESNINDDKLSETLLTEKKKEKPNLNNTELTLEQLERINKAAHIVNSNVKIDDVLKKIVDVSVSLCQADRGTLYLVDKSKNELWSKVLQGKEQKRIALNIGDGFAGWAAENKSIVNVEDASLDNRFNSSFDKLSGYKTQSVLCFPIKNKNEDVVGVIQLLNSKNGAFTKLDEKFLYALSTNAALALQNADLVEQLLKTERISSLGKMANFLIEDIKKPILVSKRYTEHLKKKDLSEDVLNVVNMLLEQLNNIADLVQSTSNYSNGTSVLQSSEMNLGQALDEFVERAESYVQTMQCRIIKNYDADVKINIDAKEFYQGFKHIIKNACEAMQNGGDINLSTKLKGDKVSIVFNDSGVGIPAGFNTKIFEPFVSFGKKSGTGLGLSVTKKIIEEHNGNISANSDFGVGSTIEIILPVV